MADFYWALAVIGVTVIIAMVISTVVIEFVLAPWYERRQDLRRMIGK